jgi:hypothetical protein
MEIGGAVCVTLYHEGREGSRRKIMVTPCSFPARRVGWNTLRIISFRG